TSICGLVAELALARGLRAEALARSACLRSVRSTMRAVIAARCAGLAVAGASAAGFPRRGGAARRPRGSIVFGHDAASYQSRRAAGSALFQRVAMRFAQGCAGGPTWRFQTPRRGCRVAAMTGNESFVSGTGG